MWRKFILSLLPWHPKTLDEMRDCMRQCSNVKLEKGLQMHVFLKWGFLHLHATCDRKHQCARSPSSEHDFLNLSACHMPVFHGIAATKTICAPLGDSLSLRHAGQNIAKNFLSFVQNTCNYALSGLCPAGLLLSFVIKAKLTKLHVFPGFTFSDDHVGFLDNEAGILRAHLALTSFQVVKFFCTGTLVRLIFKHAILDMLKWQTFKQCTICALLCLQTCRTCSRILVVRSGMEHKSWRLFLEK